METKVSMQAGDLESRWRLRENQWRRKLGRLKLGVEPIEEQLARYRRVTWALTAVPCLLGLIFLTLFTVFGRPDIGLIFDSIMPCWPDEPGFISSNSANTFGRRS
jgi:hypothetical protein